MNIPPPDLNHIGSVRHQRMSHPNPSPFRLIIFTRYPIPGKTKTRLIPALGPWGAARLQEIMTGHAMLQGRCCAAANGADMEVRFEGGNARKLQAWLGVGVRYVPQGAGHLGQRMARAFADAFSAGAQRVVLMGSDCPEMTAEYLAEAFAALADHDLVIGPAHDGGYTLIGLRSLAPVLFDGMSWGTDTVFRDTWMAACSVGMRAQKLKPLSDVDLPRDLPVWHRVMNPEKSAETLSIIIPTLNEQSTIAETLNGIGNRAAEIIVADGGSTDHTIEQAQAAEARVLVFPHGRAAQMNSAALAATGSTVLFLHADTRLPKGFAADVFQALRLPDIAAGAFSLKIDADGSRFRMVSALANFRSRRLQMPYGDQALFMKRDTFIRLGGFANFPIMEDFELVLRLRRRHGGIITLNREVTTSSRRWQRLGVLRTTLINQLMIAGYCLQISPSRLAAFYKKPVISQTRGNTNHDLQLNT